MVNSKTRVYEAAETRLRMKQDLHFPPSAREPPGASTRKERQQPKSSIS
jgi:hypothetical protein